ncbi:hypothetical protein Tco_0320064 [Tanacetum coccineum]
MGDDVDISALTIEQYLALIQDNNRPGIVKPKIGDDVKFEINSNFIRELRSKLFAGTNDEDAHEHVRRVLEVVDLFHFPGVTHDAVMLRVFPITLNGRALSAKKLEEIHNFKQEIDETLYHAWERYSDLFYKCLQHDLNCQQKVHIFYTGLDISTRRMLDSRGFITLMTPTQALISLQVMADHSHNCVNEAHLTKECPLKKEENAVEHREKFKARTTMGKENMKEPVPSDLPPTPFLGHLKEQLGSPYRTRETVCMVENPWEVHKLKAQEDEGDMDVIHITSPDDHYVAPATRPTLDKQLNEFGKECSDITRVAEMADGNPIKDIKELSDII